MFSPLFIVPKSRYALNQAIVSRLEFFGITFDAHPHSGWFICLAPCGARRTNSHIIKKHLHVFKRRCLIVCDKRLCRINRRCGRNSMPLVGCSCCEILVCVEVSKW